MSDMPDSNVEAVREKLRTRAEHGLQKYGVTTERTDLGLIEWLNHLQQELMDACVYIERTLNDKGVNPDAKLIEEWVSAHPEDKGKHIQVLRSNDGKVTFAISEMASVFDGVDITTTSKYP